MERFVRTKNFLVSQGANNLPSHQNENCNSTTEPKSTLALNNPSTLAAAVN